VISTNDYLAGRDCEEMSPLFAFFGLGGACVRSGMEADERRRAYRHAVCYVSGKELVFDYLKDRLAGHGVLPARVGLLRQLSAVEPAGEPPPLIPALHFAIVDEADSVLIDEARTPMILSREAPGVYEPELLRWAIGAAGTLREGVHYRSVSAREIELLPGAAEHAGEVPPGVRPVWRSRPWRELLLRQALTALHLFHRDQHYILAEGKVQIVDESTGRVMADRSWEQGLHQLIEAKEGLELTQGRETLARMTFQAFFRRYYLLAGLTGTAAEAARELWSVYRLKVRRIPPHRPNRRRRHADRCLPTLQAKWHAVVDEAARMAARGQPVLIGTRSVEASEQVQAELQRRGLDHVVLNARQDKEEAGIVARAGEPGRVTVATNMAGRGTDIKLTPAAREAGGLHVILTEFHESPRVDRQLVGRSGRQGDPGSAAAIVSAEDGLFHTLPGPWKRLLARGGWLLRLAVRHAQARAERRAYRSRMQTLRQDRELNRLIGFAGRIT
jgi:preprotein translocase subunit SecA